MLAMYYGYRILIQFPKNLGVGKELDKLENAECAAFVSLVNINLLNSLVSCAL